MAMNSYEEKTESLVKKFLPLSPEHRYAALIEMGRNLPLYPDELMTPDRKVPGCQSTLYLNVECHDGRLYFQAHADALISAGLAALLIAAYNGEPAETILTTPPDFIQDIGINSSLSMNRSNGLYHIHLKMKQLALALIVKISYTVPS